MYGDAFGVRPKNSKSDGVFSRPKNLALILVGLGKKRRHLFLEPAVPLAGLRKFVVWERRYVAGRQPPPCQVDSRNGIGRV